MKCISGDLRIIFLLMILGLSSCKKAPTSPVVTTDEVSNVSTRSAVSGGNVIDNGKTPVATRGICWDTSPNPVKGYNYTLDNGGLGIFVSTMTS